MAKTLDNTEDLKETVFWSQDKEKKEVALKALMLEIVAKSKASPGRTLKEAIANEINAL